MTQDVFPEIQAATRALEQRIATTETELAQMKDTMNEKKRLIKGLRKAIAAVEPAPKTQRVAAS